ncbi:MAG: response regulator transcription factor [Tenuifilaceae bacterium]|jgi:DNA-binding NarL/FixJ family response regulator|nr:response regulator transcription factor [Bacteroidales bacterium]MDI9517187.1 response regulator transcription factor [Bacteroidota bacterium]NLH56005.1 response regulator transcription factor [Rikenellaceae bacterium]OQC63718.1 MAG: Oxygen regulatory protein NreC [Bacteroidetes bacterium ADurb.Bin008]HNV82295.1 response regulator transcription factor [Tenuifilaceae bacterium]
MDEKTIIIVDDHRIVIDGLRAILLGKPNFKILHELSSGKELIQVLNIQAPDLVILDVMLPDISGLELISIVKSRTNSKVLMLTANTDEDTVCSAVQNGADGFLDKNSSAEELIYAMEVVLDGEPYLGMNISTLIHKSYSKIVNELRNDANKPKISDREAEVIKLLATGLSFKEIAIRLNISPRTVESHKNNILLKLDLKNTVDLLKYAFKHKLVEL